MIAQKKEAMVFGKNGATGKEGLQREMEQVRRMKEQVIQEKNFWKHRRR